MLIEEVELLCVLVSADEAVGVTLPLDQVLAVQLSQVSPAVSAGGHRDTQFRCNLLPQSFSFGEKSNGTVLVEIRSLLDQVDQLRNVHGDER